MVRCKISGRVQKVGFRNWVQRTASQLNLSGWVKNQTDGTVLAQFVGAAEQVDAMLAQCRHGPLAAKVTAVEVLDSRQTDVAALKPEFNIVYE